MSLCFELDLKVTNTGLESLGNDILTCNMGKIKSDIVVYCSKLGWHVPGADKSLVWPTSQCVLFDGENISFDASLVICIYKWY